ncbi:hypothetical protein [Nocardia tenerifensis]|uniref:hypothetical protein n=1 Tax=Nocardia tenerifensis TaxID=228006 RepID=UPI0012F6587E|nr:hypothetical protein [Nocardia tenerifensis]
MPNAVRGNVIREHRGRAGRTHLHGCDCRHRCDCRDWRDWGARCDRRSYDGRRIGSAVDDGVPAAAASTGDERAQARHPQEGLGPGRQRRPAPPGVCRGEQ